MKIKFLDSTKQDFRWIDTYYRNVFPAGRANYLKNLEKTLQLLEGFPLVGEAYFDCRKRSIHRTPFSLVYFIEDETICVVRIEDGRNILNKYSSR